MRESRCGDCGARMAVADPPEVPGIRLLGCLNPQCENSIVSVRELVLFDAGIGTHPGESPHPEQPEPPRFGPPVKGLGV